MSFDVVWTEDFKWWEKPLGYYRLLRARKNYGERIALANPVTSGSLFRRVQGYQARLKRLRGIHSGKRCFIIGNGPSLRKMDLSPLRNEITIGSNGIYRLFPEMGFHTTYLTMEDIAQCEDRRREIGDVKGPIKIFGLHSAYCVPPDESTLFMNVYLRQDGEQRFSEDCSATTYLGSTVTYMNLQLAFHLGCDPVYLIGVDFNYGDIEKTLSPGRVIVTETVMKEISGAHFDDDYHRVGSRFGVPFVEKQYRAYQKADEVFRSHGRRIYNAGYDSALDVLEKVGYEGLFENGSSDGNEGSTPSRHMDPNDELMVLAGARPARAHWRRLYDKGLALYGGGDMKRALKVLRRSVAARENIPACYLLGVIQRQAGEVREAVRLFERILSNPGPHPDRSIEMGSHYHLGEIHYRRESLIEAQFHLEHCLDAPPFDARAYELLERIRAECESESFVGEGIGTGVL